MKVTIKKPKTKEHISTKIQRIISTLDNFKDDDSLKISVRGNLKKAIIDLKKAKIISIG